MKVALCRWGASFVLILCAGIANGSCGRYIDNVRDVLPVKVNEVKDIKRVGHHASLDESATKEVEFVVDDGHGSTDQRGRDIAGGDAGGGGQIRDGLKTWSLGSWHDVIDC